VDAFPWNQVGIGSGWGLAAFFFWLVYSGRMVTKTQHDREIERADHDAAEWRAEGRIKDQQIAELQTQNRHVREVGQTVNAIMRSIGHNARSGDRISREEDS
jgi:hypothetical protein